MKILDRYLAWRILRGFVLALVAFLSMFIFIDLLTHRGEAILDNEAPWPVVARYYVALMPRLLADFHFAGLATMLTILLVVGTIARRNELAASLASGIPLLRILRTPIAFAILVSVALLALSEFEGPYAWRRAINIEDQYFGGAANFSSTKRDPVSWPKLSGGWTCHVAKFNRAAMSGEEVLMLANRAGTEEQIRAARIYWDPAARAWMFEDGLWFVFYSDQVGVPVTKRRITLERAPIVETPQELFAPLEEPSIRSWEELRTLIKKGAARGIPVAPLQAEWHARLARAAMPFVMVCVAAPLAARIRRSGRAAGYALAIGLGLLYIILDGATQSIGVTGRIAPAIAVWSTNFFFLFGGLLLYRRTPA